MTVPDRFLLFVSYSCRDSEHPFLLSLREFFARPEVSKVATCFMAEDVPAYGSDFIAKVLDALGRADAVLPFVTAASQLSPWVNQEIGFACARGVPVLPAFDPQGVERLQGMIQTTDGCPVDNAVNVEALLKHVLALAAQDPATRRNRLSIAVMGTWWSEYKQSFPLYVRLEVTHDSKESDAVRRVYLECANRTVELESIDIHKLEDLRPAAYKQITLKFFPTGSGQVERMKLVIQTVRGKQADAVFNAAPSGWTPPVVWKDFTPY